MRPESDVRMLDIADLSAPPHFKSKPEQVIYVKVGESVVLPCEAEGTPPPTIIWYKVSKHVCIMCFTPFMGMLLTVPFQRPFQKSHSALEPL